MKKLILLGLLLPIMAFAQNETVVKHHDFTIYYNPSIRMADSVSWNYTKGCPVVARKDAFKQDPLIPGSHKPSDWIQISKDKKLEGAQGHIFSYQSAMCSPYRQECFLMSNMYWQYQSFNAGDWKVLEAYERTLTNTHVIAGFIGLGDTLSTGVIIPKYMYKAIRSDGKWLCWIMPNLPTSHGHALKYWQVNTTTLNEKTGLRL